MRRRAGRGRKADICMKTVGILMLFGLCTVIGMRLASRKTERYRRVRALRNDLRRFSESIASTNATLVSAANGNDGAFFAMLQDYLTARGSGAREADAAEDATQAMRMFDSESHALTSFFNGLSACSLRQLCERTETLDVLLANAEKEAEETAKQAKTIRAVGVLVGVGISILLL